jgi:hypothetical protein
MVILLLALLIVAGDWTLAKPSTAQDSHYWTMQYGPRSTLLGGAVVGSLMDVSSTYYNPGALGLIEDPSVVLSAYAFQRESVKLRFADGSTDLSSARLGPSPGLVAGLFPSHWLPGLLAWSALTRADFDARTTDRIDYRQDGESVAAEFLYDQDMTEVWGGLTWSVPLYPGLGAGLTQYLAYRGQRTRLQATVNKADSSGVGASTTLVDSFDYFTYRLIWKLGLAFSRGPWTLGLAMTTPSVPLYGSGSAAFERSVITSDGSSNSEVISRSEGELDAEYRSPFSLAIGAEYEWGNTLLFATTEWFDDVPLYDVVLTDSALGSRPGAALRRRLSAELKSVTNVAVGIEQHFSDKFLISGSFTTDFSAAIDGSVTTHSLSDWDIYHINLGTAVTVSGLELTLGIGHAFGSDSTERPRDFEPESQRFGPEVSRDATIEYSRWTLLIGFTFSI